MKLLYKLNSRKYKFCSSFGLKIYKKFLSIKLSVYYNKCNYYNILNKKIRFNPNKLINQTKIFYNRKELIPIRILRYYAYFNISTLLNLGISKILTNRLSVYNGKKAKPINIYKGLVEKLVKCRFKFGDLIFTRYPHIFKHKSKKSKK